MGKRGVGEFRVGDFGLVYLMWAVMMAAMMQIRASDRNKVSMPISPCNTGKVSAPITAPDLAIAPASPAPLALIAGGNTSPDNKKVVEFGPKFMVRLNRINPVNNKVS